MPYPTHKAAHQAIVKHVMDAVDRENSKELRIALLTRDAIDEIAERIIGKFVRKLKEKLTEEDKKMEKPKGKSDPGEKYSRILWRHPDWPKGAGICLEFQKHNLAGLIGGFRAPNMTTWERLNEKDRAEYEAVDGPVREEIRRTISQASSLFSNRSTAWWPVWNWLPHPLDDWKKTDALLKVAGFEIYQGEALVDRIADEFVRIRKAICDAKPPIFT